MPLIIELFTEPTERGREYGSAYKEYVFKNNIDPFQSLFTEDMGHGINDKYTKSDAYFIIQRYFDNGGNIYEIYDYINNHKELSFLKDTKTIYPDIFQLIENRRSPFTYSDNGMYAYLAYLEVLEKQGYAGVAITSSLAGQYAKMAFYKTMILEDKSKGESLNYPNYTQKEIENDISKALFFLERIKNNITEITGDSTISKDVVESDILVGVIQYGSAIRYLEALGINFDSPVTSGAVFSFAITYSHKFLPELYLSTAITNASTLLLVKPNNNELRNAVYPFLDFNSRTNKPTGIVYKVINSRFDKSVSRFSDLNAYSMINIVALAKKVPEFKKWLVANGWNEEDFR